MNKTEVYLQTLKAVPLFLTLSFIPSDLPETSLHLKEFSSISPHHPTSHYILHTHAGLLCIVTIIMIARLSQQMFLIGVRDIYNKQLGPWFLMWTVKYFKPRGSVLCLWLIHSFGTITQQHTFSLCSMSLSFESYCCSPSVQSFIMTFSNMTLSTRQRRKWQFTPGIIEICFSRLLVSRCVPLLIFYDFMISVKRRNIHLQALYENHHGLSQYIYIHWLIHTHIMQWSIKCGY